MCVATAGLRVELDKISEPQEACIIYSVHVVCLAEQRLTVSKLGRNMEDSPNSGQSV